MKTPTAAHIRQRVRSFLLLPLFALLLVVIPALLLSWMGTPSAALGQTVPLPPTGTPLPTLKPPVATPTRRPTTVPPQSPLPTPTARPTLRPTATPPKATPRPGADGRVRVEGVVLARAIGDRRTGTVYGISERGVLYRSDDNGIYWDRVTTAPEVTDFILSPVNPSILYSSLPLVCETDPGDPGSISVSVDSGDSWMPIEVSPALEPIWADGEDDERVIAAACNGLYESEDGGVTWLPLATTEDDLLWSQARAVEIEDAGDLLYALLQLQDGGSLVAVSNDGGVTWAVISPALADDPFVATALAVDPASTGHIWAAGPQGVWITEDLGQFWGLSASGLAGALPPSAKGLHDVVYHPRDLLFVATDAGFYSKRTTDLPWRKLGSETVGLRIDSLLLTESAPRRLWL
ncbi:MAG: hypothetical protein ACRC1H_06480, partial [Caldilineaceae bacterium]